MKWLFTLPVCLLVACGPQHPTVSLGDLPGISQPHSLHVVGNDLVFLDGHTIRVYSMNPLEPKLAFAGEGDGEDQLQYWPRVGIHDNAVYAMDYVKTRWFSLDGELLRAITYADFADYEPGMEMELAPVGENFVRVTVNHETNRRFVQLFDKNLQLLSTLHEGLFDWQGAVPRYRIDATCDGEHIVVSDSERGFFVKIFDAQGNLRRTIDKSDEVEAISFTDADRDEYMESARLREARWVYEQLSQNPNFKDYFPLTKNVQVDGDRLYATTWRKQGDRREIVVLDLEGRILERIFVPLRSFSLSRRILRFDPYVIHEGRLYEMVRNESTDMFELLVTQLD